MNANNKLIADFLGWKKVTFIRDSNGIYYDYQTPSNMEIIGESEDESCSDCGRDTYYKHHLFNDDLKFHSDWNWLMVVIKKIYELDIYYDKYIQEHTSMLGDGQIKITTDINDMYKQCVYFVQWYNKNKDE